MLGIKLGHLVKSEIPMLVAQGFRFKFLLFNTLPHNPEY